MSLANFHEVSFPLALAKGARGGPERRTEVVQLASGAEARNGIWAGSRRRWEVGSAAMKLEDVYALTAFFEARRGRLHGFRFRDFGDDCSGAPGGAVSAGDQVIGVGDGISTDFPLTKRYGDVVRRILKPVAGAVRVAVDGVEVSGFSVDALGVVSLNEAPAVGAEVTAGYHFDCAARFDADMLEVMLEGIGAGRAVRVPIVELQI